jgi:hypothetical protein
MEKQYQIPVGIKINDEFYSFHSDVWKSIVGKFRRKFNWYTNGKEDVFSMMQPKGFTVGRTKHNQIADYIEQDGPDINAVQISNVCLEGEDYFEECDSDF